MRILTVKQPWASLLVSGQKIFENRSWHTKYRGPIAIHAGCEFPSLTDSQILEKYDVKINRHILPRGAIIGVATLEEIVTDDESIWFEGPYGWRFINAHQLYQPIPHTGKLGLMNIPTALANQIEENL